MPGSCSTRGGRRGADARDGRRRAARAARRGLCGGALGRRPRLLREVRDPGAPWPETLRFFFNLPSSGCWPRSTRPCGRRRTGAGARRRRGDRARLRRQAQPRRDRARRLHAGRLAVPGRDPRAPAGPATTGASTAPSPPGARDMFETYEVAFLYADPWKWQSELEEWGRAVARTRGRVADQLGATDGAGRRPVPQRDRGRPTDPRRRPGADPARAERAAAPAAGTRTAEASTCSRRRAGTLIDACVAACSRSRRRCSHRVPPEPFPFLAAYT